MSFSLQTFEIYLEPLSLYKTILGLYLD